MVSGCVEKTSGTFAYINIFKRYSEYSEYIQNIFLQTIKKKYTQ